MRYHARRRHAAPYWEVYRVCGHCKERRIVATFTKRNEALHYASAKRGRDTEIGFFFEVERGF